MPCGKTLELTAAKIKEKADPMGPFELLVVGLPLLLNGKEGEMAQEARKFSEALQSAFQIPVILWDERLTSSQADRMMKEDDRSRKERSKSIDTLSATLILQNYLDSKFLQRPQI